MERSESSEGGGELKARLVFDSRQRLITKKIHELSFDQNVSLHENCLIDLIAVIFGRSPFQFVRCLRRAAAENGETFLIYNLSVVMRE